MTDVWEQVKALSRRIQETSRDSTWELLHVRNGGILDWQRQALSELVALLNGEEVLYLDSSIRNAPHGQIVVFTATRVIEINASGLDWATGSGSVDSSTYARRTLEALRVELDQENQAYPDVTEFPIGLRVTLTFKRSKLRLPLTDTPSNGVKRELLALYPSLLPS